MLYREFVFSCRAIPTAGMTLADRHALTRRLWDLAVKELTPPDMVVPPELFEAERPKLSGEKRNGTSTAPIRSTL
jgi:hypothetical protein